VTPELTPEALAGLLAVESRLRVLAAVTLGAGDEAAVVEMTGLAPRDVQSALQRLVAGGVVGARSGAGFTVRTEAIRHAARRAGEARRAREVDPESLGATPEQARVLRNFMSEGRLSSIPTTRSKRLVVLDFLAGRFDPGVRYTEKQVNARLSEFHADVAALRRYLVDEGLLSREKGAYWRTGGTVEVD
jgi:hypothetical protein